MGSEVYFVPAIIVENGVKTKSTLILYEDKYEFNDVVKSIDWEKASCTTGTTKVKSFIFTIEKPHVIIWEGDSCGPAFVMEQSQIDQLTAKVGELRELTKQKRIAEEEKRRQEEEEERKRKEALAKRLRDRQNRIVEEVEASKASATQVDLTGGNNLVLRKAWSIIADNPYRILGISVAATAEEANASLDKIKKLARLNAVASFKSEFHLNGTSKPERDISIVQNAFTSTKEMKNKWFWFTDSDACAAWQSEEYRGELVHDGLEYATYDLFLANYYYALIFDPVFEKSNLWKPVFTSFAYICSQSSHALLKSRFNKRELEQIRVLDAVRSFKAEIFKPLQLICDSEDVTKIIRLYKVLKENADSSVDEVRTTIMSKMTKWFAAREESVCKLINESDEDHVITQQEAREINKAGNDYINEVDSVLDSALSALKNETVRYEMIKESYRHATWQVMFALNKAGDKDRAVFYANKCYPYCDESDKRKIRNTFGFNAIKGSEQDATHAEWDILGDNYYEGKNGYDQDYHKAFKWYKKAAEAGNMYSQNSLGICFREGNGTSKNDYEAARWFEKAYRNGNPDGAFNLARCYAIGEGKTANQKKAIDLYIEAAKMGHPTAAEMGKKLIDLMMAEQKLHRLTQHNHYDLGFQVPIGETIIVEVTLNYSANVYLMEEDDYDKYKACENFSYYGGRATQSPYRLKIPHTGSWHLVIDNGDDDMTGIIASVSTRTFNF